jgi:hypothetical protein
LLQVGERALGIGKDKSGSVLTLKTTTQYSLETKGPGGCSPVSTSFKDWLQCASM